MTTQQLPAQLLEVNESPYAAYFASITPLVSTLYYISHNLEDIFARPRVAIVGNRTMSPYGREVTNWFARELARRGIVIVSGLALGVDATAHRAALDAGGTGIAVLPSSLERIYPSAHRRLAHELVEQGGALFSEYPPGSDIAYKNQFIERNRIVCGISNVLLITEAGQKSGSLHTGNFAVEQGKHILVVPGSIYSPGSVGVHNLLKQGQAAVATSPQDVLQLLGLTGSTAASPPTSNDPNEMAILQLLYRGIRDGDQLLAESSLSPSIFGRTLTMLELYGHIRPLGNNHWTLT